MFYIYCYSYAAEHTHMWCVNCVEDPTNTLLSCLNFLDDAWWFLSVRVFGLLSFFYNVLAAVSSGLLQVSPVYFGIEMIQTGKSFLKFDFMHGLINSQTLKNDIPGWIISMRRKTGDT